MQNIPTFSQDIYEMKSIKLTNVIRNICKEINDFKVRSELNNLHFSIEFQSRHL